MCEHVCLCVCVFLMLFFWLLPLCLSCPISFCLFCFIWPYLILLPFFRFLFVFQQRKKRCGWNGRHGGPGRSWARPNRNQNILYGKKNLFSIEENWKGRKGCFQRKTDRMLEQNPFLRIGSETDRLETCFPVDCEPVGKNMCRHEPC